MLKTKTLFTKVICPSDRLTEDTSGKVARQTVTKTLVLFLNPMGTYQLYLGLLLLHTKLICYSEFDEFGRDGSSRFGGTHCGN